MKLKPTKAFAVYWQYKGRTGFIDVYKNKWRAEAEREALSQHLDPSSHTVVPVAITPSLKRG